MLISIIGTHGIPARYGGFETFASHLADACINAGIKVRMINERDNPVQASTEYLEIISSDYNKGESTLKFYKDSLRLAAGSDLILCCGVGGSFYYSSATSSKIKLITNVDGLEHRRKRYTFMQRMTVYFLQLMATRKSDILICDSETVKTYWSNRFPQYKSKLKKISYGADSCLPFDQAKITRYGLVKDGYFLVIARLVPENNLKEIIEAFNHYIGNKKLVIVGKLDDSPFCKRLLALSNDYVIFTDAIYDRSVLDSLRQGCSIYIHGHSVGGTNPSLLEAMAAGCACICHENEFNREVTNNSQIYFRSSNDLAIMLNLLEHKKPDLDELRSKALLWVRNEYSWEKVCSEYIELFRELSDKK